MQLQKWRANQGNIIQVGAELLLKAAFVEVPLGVSIAGAAWT